MRLVAENLSRSFGTPMIIGPLSFSVETGRVLGVAGENGSGKTTLLEDPRGPDSAERRVREDFPGR